VSKSTRWTRRAAAAAAAGLALAAGPAADAMTLKKQNLTRLIAESQSIVSGRVSRTTDGITENGVPYTEITISVSDVAKGSVRGGSDYTFRQFGLLRPRRMPNGRTLLAVSPEGFPRWAVGEGVVAFLHRPAARTGLQTTAGLAQGKLSLVNGRARNEFDNHGLFDGVRFKEGLLSAGERQMVSSRGPVDAATFIGLVGRAVSGNWIATGEMR
jgi:hypothetical protein